MNTQNADYCPDGTYFTAADVEPTIEQDGTITIYNGHGTRRSWGAPQVNSTVILDECDLLAVHVGFSHKHRGGQAWYYYTSDGSETRRVKWAQLSDEVRQRILDAAAAKAPAWAKSPGKLSSERSKPADSARTAYKLVQMDDVGRLISIYDGRTEYAIGKRLAERAEEDHNGGYYSHPTADQVMQLYRRNNLVPPRRLHAGTRYALIECQIAGRLISYPNGKIASTYLTPLAIIDTFVHQPAAEPAPVSS